MEKQCVITILGTIGKKGNELNFASYIDEKNNTHKEPNMFTYLIKNYSKTHEIIPIYTLKSKECQIEVLKDSSMDLYNNKFFDDDKFLIKDDKDFDEIFSMVDRLINQFNEIIIDISHGFRHLPILMIINIIIRGLKEPEKISKILFAKEIVPLQKYEIIDLKKYTDIATLSFIIVNFQDNYNISKKIKIQNKDYKPLIDAMNNFSDDVLSLSLENLFKNSSKMLKEKIDEVSKNEIIPKTLKEDLTRLSRHIDNVFSFENKKRYDTYLVLAKDFVEKNYLVNGLAMLNESIGFFITHILKNKTHLRSKIEKIEDRIKNKIENKIENKKITNYDLSNNIRVAIRKSITDDKKIFIEFTSEDFEYIREIFPENFKDFIQECSRLRNNLLHANSSNHLSDAKIDIEKLIKSYEEHIKDILKIELKNNNNQLIIEDIKSNIDIENIIENELKKYQNLSSLISAFKENQIKSFEGKKHIIASRLLERLKKDEKLYNSMKKTDKIRREFLEKLSQNSR